MTAAFLTVLVASVLAVSGSAKLLDPRGSAQTLRGFGIPDALVRPLSLGLPLTELALAAGLLAPRTAAPAAAAAAGLFTAFAAGVAVTLLRGRRPDCGCLGRLHSTPIGWPTVARAATLVAAAGFLAVGGTGGGVGRLAGDPAAWLVAAVGAQSVFLAAVLRRHGKLLARVEELDAPGGAALESGDPAPHFELPDLAGERLSLHRLLTGHPLLLVFTRSGCEPCTALLPEVARWQREHGRRVTVALVAQGDAELNRAHALEHGLGIVLLDGEHAVAEAYGVEGTPAAALIGADARVQGTLRYGADGVKALLEQALAAAPQPRAALVRHRATPVAAGASTAAVVAPSALAAPAGDEDAAFAELRRILAGRNPALKRHAANVARITGRLIEAPRSESVRFELTAAIAVSRTELRRTIDDLEAVAVPDYRPGEKGARLAKSNAISVASLTSRMLDSQAAVLKAKTLREIRRLTDEIARFGNEAEKNRRLLSKRFGCTKRLEDC